MTRPRASKLDHAGSMLPSLGVIFSILIGAVVLGAGCAPAPRAPEALTEDELRTEVEAFLESYLTAIAERDEEALRERLNAADRYRWAEDGEIRYRSVDAMLEGLGQFPADTRIETELDDLRVVTVGTDGSWAVAGFETRMGVGEQAFSFGGTISFVLERGEDGWRIVGGHASSTRQRPPE